MSEPAREIDDLIVQFVNIYSSLTDTGLDLFLKPPPPFLPLNSYTSRKEAANYLLIAAALSDSSLTGNARNIRLLLDHLYGVFGKQLYSIVNAAELTFEINKFNFQLQNLDSLGPEKHEIPNVIASVNKFVKQKANGDLLEYSAKLRQNKNSIEELAKQLSFSIRYMNGQNVAKVWLYLRWMVRSSPDLHLFEFDPKELTVPLTTPKLRVATALNITDDETLPFKLNAKQRPKNWFPTTAEFEEAQNKLTSYARKLFPTDPAKVDFPFFILGTWLEDSDLTPTTLEKTLKFFINKYRQTLQPPIRYLTAVPHHKQGQYADTLGTFGTFEKNIYKFLKEHQEKFEYEFLEFHLPKKEGAACGHLTYRPDFLLPRKTHRGRKLLLEPHGTRNGLKEFLSKLVLFRDCYGEHFALALIVPDDYINEIQNLDVTSQAYDFLWKSSTYKHELETFQST